MFKMWWFWPRHVLMWEWLFFWWPEGCFGILLLDICDLMCHRYYFINCLLNHWLISFNLCLSSFSSSCYVVLYITFLVLQDIECYVCGSSGHLCCVNYTDMGPKEITCYRCGLSGHTGLVSFVWCKCHLWFAMLSLVFIFLFPIGYIYLWNVFELYNHRNSPLSCSPCVWLLAWKDVESFFIHIHNIILLHLFFSPNDKIVLW